MPLPVSRTMLLAASLSVFTACGGGGGGGSGNGQNNPTMLPTPTLTPTPSPTANPGGSLSISEISALDTRLISVSGTSANVVGALSLSLNNKTYAITPQSDGAWSIRFEQCDDELDNGNYLARISGTAADNTTVNAQESFTVNAPIIGDQIMHVNYFRVDGDYDGWGLHLWGDALAQNTKTTWPVNRPFDCLTGDWALARVPYIDDSKAFNFITHRDGRKSPNADLSLTINEFGSQVFVVQDNSKLFLSEDVALSALGNASADLDLSDVAATNLSSPLPSNWNRSANFIQIFVRSYQDSDGDGVGDLAGLTSRLPYLAELGITGIWLMPVTEANDGDHGYQVTDYRSIEQDYGTLEDFQTLLTEAHDLGIGIIIDYVVNHSSSANPLFSDANFSPENDKRDWYSFSPTDPGWQVFDNSSAWRPSANGGFYYGVFGGGLPDFNLANPETEAYHLNNLRYWLNMGVDGFRIDAAGVLFEDANGTNLEHNPQNLVFLKKMLDVVNQYENRYLICEAPNGSEPYASPNTCGNAFAFGTQFEILDSARDGNLRAGLVSQLHSAARAHMPLFLSNHDSFAGARPYTRFLTCDECGHINEANVNNYMKVASSINILASNTPFTYYGEEVGMAGDRSSDPSLRRPMSWNGNTSNAGFSTAVPYRELATNLAQYNVESEKDVANSLYEHYEMLFQVRKKNQDVFANGDFNLQSTAGDSHLIFTRSVGERTAAVFINLSNNSAATLSSATGRANTDFVNQVNPAGTVSSDAQGNISVNLSPQSFAVFVNEE